MRLLLVALLLSSCTGDCSGVGAVGSMRAGDMQHGAARGGMTLPVDGDDAPVGVQWTIPPVFEYAAYLESGADNDPIETPACRGTLCSTLALTQATLDNRPTLRLLCPVGATTLPCYRVDGGDWVADAATRSELAFMHNGLGATCMVVFETSLNTQQSPMHTGDTSGPAPGFSFWYSSGQTYAQIQNLVGAVSAAAGASSTLANTMNAVVAIDLVADTPDTGIFVNDFTSALGTNSLGSRDTGAPNNPLRWGGNWGGSGSNVTGYIPLIACWSQRLTTAEREAEQVNLETYFGGAFPL